MKYYYVYGVQIDNGNPIMFGDILRVKNEAAFIKILRSEIKFMTSRIEITKEEAEELNGGPIDGS